MPNHIGGLLCKFCVTLFCVSKIRTQSVTKSCKMMAITCELLLDLFSWTNLYLACKIICKYYSISDVNWVAVSVWCRCKTWLAGLGRSVGCTFDWWSGGCRFDPVRSATFFLGDCHMSIRLAGYQDSHTILDCTIFWLTGPFTCKLLAPLVFHRHIFGKNVVQTKANNSHLIITKLANYDEGLQCELIV